MGDPVDGKFQILRTTDGGASWDLLPSDGMPDATGEYGFAASGDCLVVSGRTAYFGTGGDRSRIFSSTDRGLTWTATDSAIPANETPEEAAGVFGLAFGKRQGVAVGGDFAEPTEGASSRQTAGGWTSGGPLTHLAEDAAFLPGGRLLATGESGDVRGTSWSRDGGRTWTHLSETGFHTLDCVGATCFAAGGKGRVAVVSLRG